ncbi:formate-dependent phosphoribosylglycinamide formyltransferase [Lyngbya confervoides]|uniref:Formate-dependent phosphoribosylglycinamide formyltransferase n=1 Tax=Lyngbya confervoides BDU141951 TaxID=1574623 RepID=A0ABD4T6T7_9CYAN|nr:formate-dependent phosphoribosylglycinamide formyltransferase [Lyngbya confervoides]MCM1984154.1 formate-dependent phosphoribosylglycinamide formyltransferase [Lyngbya confervoides BDU141951]
MDLISPRCSPLWGTPLQPQAKRILLLGSGELGREVALEAMRLGVEVIAVDAYAEAPAMQIAHRAHVIPMLEGQALRRVVLEEKPDYIVPEVEAIDTNMLLQLESEGWRVVPTAQATRLTMNREGIRRLAAEDLGLKTSPYRFASTLADYQRAIAAVGFPCVVKPIMSSSGKGQSTVRCPAEIQAAWDYAQCGGRAQNQPVIVEGFVAFDCEITLLTVRAVDGTHFCPPVGHVQVAGDYRESWQPCNLSESTRQTCEAIAETITAALGGWGLFGVELFIQNHGPGEPTVYFSEVSPRPHDTGMVTMVSQNMSEFELHVRAMLGLPVGQIELLQPGASAVILAPGPGMSPCYSGISQALQVPTSKLRLFGKPTCRNNRRMGVALALGQSVQEARDRAKMAAAAVTVHPGSAQ